MLENIFKIQSYTVKVIRASISMAVKLQDISNVMKSNGAQFGTRGTQTKFDVTAAPDPLLETSYQVAYMYAKKILLSARNVLGFQAIRAIQQNAWSNEVMGY